MTNRTTAAEDPIIKAARAENAKRAKENTEIEQEDKVRFVLSIQQPKIRLTNSRH